MDRLTHKTQVATRRAGRVRASLTGTEERPRLSVYISNLHISAQIIDDTKSATLVHATTVGRKLEGNMTAKATTIGDEIAKKALKAKINKVVFDRGPKSYHGRVKNLADAARAGGLEF
ncbi:MAG: 50S ribosomal protein L18 [bacterium]|nr:50S ribosomal protein L18 [bacterium]